MAARSIASSTLSLKQVVASAHAGDAAVGGQVIDLMEALRAGLGGKSPTKPRAAPVAPAPAAALAAAPVATLAEAKERKGPKRAAKPAKAEPIAAPARARAKK